MTPVWTSESRDKLSRVRAWLYRQHGNWFYARTRLTMDGWEAVVASMRDGGESYDDAVLMMIQGDGQRYDYTGRAATEFQAKRLVDAWLHKAVVAQGAIGGPQDGINEAGECLSCTQSADGSRE